VKRAKLIYRMKESAQGVLTLNDDHVVANLGDVPVDSNADVHAELGDVPADADETFALDSDDAHDEDLALEPEEVLSSIPTCAPARAASPSVAASIRAASPSVAASIRLHQFWSR
jgi:hypothetical protein